MLSHLVTAPNVLLRKLEKYLYTFSKNLSNNQSTNINLDTAENSNYLTYVFFMQILGKRAVQNPYSFFYSTSEMIGPKWHQSTIQRAPYTQLRSQRAPEQNYVEDIVKSGINFFFFQFWSFENMILNQITGGITFANNRPLLLHFTINAFRQTPITKNRWTHQPIQTAFTYFKGKCPILIQGQTASAQASIWIAPQS